MLRTRPIFASLAALMLLLPGWNAWAQKPPEGDVPEELLKALMGKDGEEEDEDEEFRPMEKATKGMEKREGFLDLYVNQKKNRVYAVFPAKLQGQPFLLATSVSRGQFAGYPWGTELLQLERFGRKLLFVSPNTFETGSDELEAVVERTYPAQIVAVADIVSVTPRGDVMIDLGKTLEKMTGMGGGFGGGPLVELTKAKSFPSNNEIELTFREVGGEDMGVHFSFSELGKSDFKPRLADERIGYFLDAQEDFSAEPDAPNRFVRYINRWNLKKADNGLKMSPPAQPIVFYIESSVPIKYRQAVYDGIVEWNKAFEKVGIVNAMVARQQTDDNEFANIDPEDARYNFIRWIATRNAFAMGPSRTDPRTGQILDADIIFDEGMVRSWTGEFDLLVDQLFNENLSPQAKRELMLRPWEHPNWPSILDSYLEQATTPADGPADYPTSLSGFMAKRLDLNGGVRTHEICNFGDEMARRNAFASLLMEGALFDLYMQDGAPAVEGGDEAPADEDEAAEGGEKKDDEAAKKKEAEKKKAEFEKKRDEFRERMIYQMIKSTTTHEVGHTLGLRHNFKASSWKTLAEIQAAKEGEAITGSVMEYTGSNLPANFDSVAPVDTAFLGPYDYWAIEYGYAIPGQNGNDRDEAKMLAKIASRSAEPGLAYLTDEDVSGPDPLCNRWDLGSDPMEYSKYQIGLADRAIGQILDRLVDDNESYSAARRAFQVAFFEYFRGASTASKFVGGHYINRSRKGDKDAQPPITVVEAAKQREAMKFLADRFLAADAVKFDPKLQRFLAAERWSHRGSRPSNTLVFPLQNMVMSLHKNILSSLLSSGTIQNLYDSSYRVEPGTDLFTLPELFDGLTTAIFSEALSPAAGEFTIQAPMISDLRRNLQREYVSRVIQIALRDETSTQPAVARSLAFAELERIKGAIDGALASGAKADAYSKAHLSEMSRRIGQALDADFTINGGGGGGNLLSLLFGFQPAGPAEPETAAGTKRPAGFPFN